MAALVDAMAPGLCPENEEMDPQNALHNASHAMKLAEDWLEVPQVSAHECLNCAYMKIQFQWNLTIVHAW